MAIKLGVVMDPISQISTKKDSTFAMLLEAQTRGWSIYYMEQKDIFVQDKVAQASCQTLTVKDDPSDWFSLQPSKTIPLSDLDVILMRKDPPFDMEYVYTTYLLELAEEQGVLVVNKPQSLRDYNEKLATTWFPQCCPAMLVSSQAELLTAFYHQHNDVIFKPLDGMGGTNVFRIQANDPNLNVIIENLTKAGESYIMAQQFIPEIKNGDKRILLIDGEPIPYALARVPKEGETRGNLAAGATAHGVELSEKDKWICQQVGPKLKEKGILFAGIDVIGDYLTEINITSPTCIRELDKIYNLNISAELMSCIELRLRSK